MLCLPAVAGQYAADVIHLLVAIQPTRRLWLPAMLSHIPHLLQWLSYLLWLLVVISVLLVFGYLFSTITNLISAPFCVLLAE